MVSLKQKILIVLSSFFIIMCEEGQDLNMDSGTNSPISIQQGGQKGSVITAEEAAASTNAANPEDRYVQLPIQIDKGESESFNLAGLEDYTLEIVGQDGEGCDRYRCSNPFTPTNNYLSALVVVDAIDFKFLKIDGKIYQPTDDRRLVVAVEDGDSCPSEQITLKEIGTDNTIQLQATECLKSDSPIGTQPGAKIAFKTTKEGESQSSDQSQAVTDALTVELDPKDGISFSGTANVAQLNATFIVDAERDITSPEQATSFWLITGHNCDEGLDPAGVIAAELYDRIGDDSNGLSSDDRNALLGFANNDLYTILGGGKGYLAEIPGLHFTSHPDVSFGEPLKIHPAFIYEVQCEDGNGGDTLQELCISGAWSIEECGD